MKKKQHLTKMFEYSGWMKNLYKRVRIMGMIGGKYVKNVKQACFNRLAKNFYVNKAPSSQSSLK